MFREVKAAGFTALGWLLLVGGWVRVAVNDTVPTVPMALSPVVVGVLAAVITSVWVRHNVSLHRQLGPRRSVAVVESAYKRDQLGRRIVGGHVPARWSEVCLTSTRRRKLYAVVD